ncbi:MAG: NDP-sugar synthase [Solirubrobacterales bacterium]|nr:NDP-sugar synthase [Solirubrobacterales bacterium]
MKAMVLAAGLGTRLRPITRAIPKPMVPVLNRPVMEHIVRLLARQGIPEVIANLHWFPDTIQDHFGDGSDFGVNLTYSHEAALQGTAGGVRQAADFFEESLLVISGDALTDIDLVAMQAFHESHDGIATLATKPVDDTSGFGVVITDQEGRVQGFQEKPAPPEALSNLANCGIYMFDRAIFDHFPAPGGSVLAGRDDPPGFADWATDVFPSLLDAGIPFYAHRFDDYWNDIGTIAELIQGNFDGLAGSVELEIAEADRGNGVRAGECEGLDRISIEGPVLIGDGCRFGDGVELIGPAVIGPDCDLGDRSGVRETVLLRGSGLAPGAFVAGGVLGI